MEINEQVKMALAELQQKEVLTGCTSYVQRKLRCGFIRACNILEELERQGWITEADGTGTRHWIKKSSLVGTPGL